MLMTTLERLRVARALSRLLPPVEWICANDSPAPFKILVACDQGYFLDHTLYLAASLAEYSPGVPLHVHLINPGDEARRELERLGRRLGALLSASCESREFEDGGEHFRTYCASIRFVRAYQLLRRRRQDLLCLDADTLIRRDLTGLPARLSGADVALRLRLSSPHEFTRVAAGTVYLGATRRAQRFVGRVALDVAAGLAAGSDWYLDQLVLYRRYVARPKRLSVMDLPAEYADWEFHDDSFIWAGKGPRKWENLSYTRFRDSLAQAVASERATPVDPAP